jgi:hypothetical protein
VLIQGLNKPRVFAVDDIARERFEAPFAVSGSSSGLNGRGQSLSLSEHMSGEFHTSLSATLEDSGLQSSFAIQSASNGSSSFGSMAHQQLHQQMQPSPLQQPRPFNPLASPVAAPGLIEPQANAMGIPDEMFRTLRRATAEAATDGMPTPMGSRRCCDDGILFTGYLINTSSMRIANTKSSTNELDDYKSRSLHSSDDKGDVHEAELARLEAAWRDSLKDTVAVRYYLRVVVQDAFDRICWNTTELILYRKESPSKSNFPFSDHV